MSRKLASVTATACELLRAELEQGPKKLYELTECLVRAEVYPWSEEPLVGLYQRLFITQSALCELYYQLEETEDDDRGALYLHLTPVTVSIRARGKYCAFDKVRDDHEGTSSRDAEGSLLKDAEGSLLKDAEGSLSQDAKGSVSKIAEGATLEDIEPSVPNFAFFANEQNFFGISADEVKRLLASFWRKYEVHFSYAELLRLLELDANALARASTKGEMHSVIRSAYRKAAAKHHPDRGGDPEAFIAIRSAYEQLLYLSPQDFSKGD